MEDKQRTGNWRVATRKDNGGGSTLPTFPFLVVAYSLVYSRNVSIHVLLSPANVTSSRFIHFFRRSFFPSFVVYASTRLAPFFSDNIKVHIVICAAPCRYGDEASSILHLNTCCIRPRRTNRSSSNDPLPPTLFADPWCSSAKLSPETSLRTLKHC